jgi:hypothetical protein
MTDTTPAAVVRLSPYAINGGRDAFAEMETDPHGDYVTHEAYAVLAAKLTTCSGNAKKYGHRCVELEAQLEAANAERDAMQAEVDRLKGGIRTAIESDESFQRHTIFRTDGMHSKHDLCVHGNPQYNDCVDCVTDYLESLLEQKP